MSDRTYQEAAAELSLPISWLQKKVAAWQIPCKRYGRYIRFADDDIAAIRAQHSSAVIVPLARNVIEMRRRAS